MSKQDRKEAGHGKFYQMEIYNITELNYFYSVTMINIDESSHENGTPPLKTKKTDEKIRLFY